MAHRGSFDGSPQKSAPSMRQDVLRHEAHRQSISAPSSSYPGRPTYRPHESSPNVQTEVSQHASHPDARPSLSMLSAQSPIDSSRPAAARRLRASAEPPRHFISCIAYSAHLSHPPRVPSDLSLPPLRSKNSSLNTQSRFTALRLSSPSSRSTS